jgi:SAM-dependent methyltransferase
MEDNNSYIKKRDLEKWNNYYISAEKENTSPPWESTVVFHALKDWFIGDSLYNDSLLKLSKTKNLKIIELGSGASYSSLWLADEDNELYAVDMSPEAIKRAKKIDIKNKVNWICADLLDENFFDNNKTLEKESFDIVFDMQCFHVLRKINERKACEVIYNLLKKGGKLMIVVGASTEPYSKDCPKGDSDNVKGPPKITIDDFLIPLTKVGMKAISIKLSRFNKTAVYGDLPPYCWIGIFEK